MVCHDDTIPTLEAQVACYRRLAWLSEVQHVHVQQGQTAELLETLAQRQELLNEIGRLEGSVEAQRRRWSAHVNEIDSQDRVRVQALLAETRRLLEEITAADRDDALVLQQRKLRLGRPVAQGAVAKRVSPAYAAAAYSSRTRACE